MKYTYFLIFHFAIVYSSDLTERTVNNRDQYNNIFKTVPVLLEHLIDILQYKPQILEKDDIKMFTMESPRIYDTSNIKNDVHKTNQKEIITFNDNKRVSQQSNSSVFNLNTRKHTNYMPVANKDVIVRRDPGTIYDEILHRYKSTNQDSNLSDIFNISNYFNEDDLEIIPKVKILNETDIRSRSDDNSTKINVIRLTAEKIIEMTLLVEKLLEEYNE